MRGAALTDRERQLLALLEAAAEAQRPAPENGELAERLGMKSISGPPALLKRLEARGMIRVARFSKSRQVTIVATGKATRAPAGACQPHFSLTRSAKRPATAAGTAASTPADPGPAVSLVRVDRDPCFRCGTRRDLGCRHYPKED